MEETIPQQSSKTLEEETAEFLELLLRIGSERPVSHNSLAETSLQKIPPDPASAQCISKRRPSGTV
jgi:hypothetical protein